MEFCFAHRSLEAKQKSVVEVRWIVHAVFVQNECVGKGTDLQEPMPVGIVPCEPGHFEPHDDTGAVHPDVCDETLEAFSPCGRCAGFTLIGVDDNDSLIGPT